MHIYIYIVYMCVYKYFYMHTYTHTHTHRCKYINGQCIWVVISKQTKIPSYLEV